MFYKVFFALIVLFYVSSAYSDDAKGILQLYESSKNFDYTLKSAEHQYKAMKEKDDQALAYLLPSVSASGKLSYYKTDIYDNYNTKNYGLGLSVPIFNMPYVYNYKQSQSVVEAYKFLKKDAEEDLIVRLADSYINAIFSYQNIKITESALENLSNQLEQAKKYYKSGLTAVTYIHEIEAEYAKKRYELISSENNYQDKLIRLNTITGVETDMLMCSDSNFFEPIEIMDLNFWISKAKKNNAVLNYYLNLKNKAEYEEKQAKSAFLPTIDGSLGYSLTNTTNYMQYPETEYRYIAISINVPIFRGGRTKSSVREMKENKFKAISDYQKAFMDIKQKISNSYMNMKNLVSQIDSLKTLVKSYEIALESHKKGLRAGISTIVDVADASNNLYQAKINLNKAKYQYFLNYIYLKYYSGTITEKDIELLDSIFNRKCNEVKF